MPKPDCANPDPESLAGEVVILPPTPLAVHRRPKRDPSPYNLFTQQYWLAHPELKQLDFQAASRHVVAAWHAQKR